MKLEQSFTVNAPLEEVWAALIDVERVAPCLPGAQITGRDDEGAYRGTFTVKLGPTTAAYNGQLKLERIDEGGRIATMSARGTDKRGQGGAQATIVNRLHADGGATRVEVATDFTITGRLARFGRSGMIEDISKRLLREFATCLETNLGGPAPVPDLAAGQEPPAPPPVAPEPVGAEGVESGSAHAGVSAGPPPSAAETPAPPPVAAPEPEPEPEAVPAAPPPPPPFQPSEPAEPLDLGSLGGAMVAERLKDPKVLAGLLTLLALIAWLVGRRG